MPGDVDKLKRILWRYARSSDPTRSFRGVEALSKIEAAERVAKAETETGYDWQRFKDGGFENLLTRLVIANEDTGRINQLSAATFALNASIVGSPFLHDTAPYDR